MTNGSSTLRWARDRVWICLSGLEKAIQHMGNGEHSMVYLQPKSGVGLVEHEDQPRSEMYISTVG